MNARRSNACVLAAIAALILTLAACREANPPADMPADPLASLTGFISPLDVPTAEAILFDANGEIARIEIQRGVFRFADLPGGTYRLEVRAFGYQTNDAARKIEVRPGTVTDIGRVILIGADDGRERTPHVRGTVLDAASVAPIENVQVAASCSAGVCSVQHARTDARGAFRVPIPADFETQLLFTADGYEGQALLIDPVPQGEEREVRVLLRPAE